MWSVWSKPVDLYLSTGFSLLRGSNRLVVVSAYESTTSVAAMLAQLEPSQFRDQRVNIYLSCALCPVVGYEVPAGVNRWDEQKELARGWAAQGASTSSPILCAIDLDQLGIAAAMDASIQVDLNAWAQTVKAKIASIAPIWSIATEWTAARKGSIRAILVQEPDGVSVIAKTGKRAFEAATLVGDIEGSEFQIRQRQTLVSLGVAEENMVSIGFERQRTSQLVGGPNAWAGHWRSL